MIKTKSVYVEPEASDGRRILVMRMWPRGISREKVDSWMKELGTDRELIKKWKSGDISWTELSKRYRAGLSGKEELLRELADESKRGTVTLLCGCRDEAHCHRSLLKAAVEKYLRAAAPKFR